MRKRFYFYYIERPACPHDPCPRTGRTQVMNYVDEGLEYLEAKKVRSTENYERMLKILQKAQRTVTTAF